METMHKRVASVTPVPLGDETTTAQVTTDTVILVANSGDFYEDGGHVRIDGEVYAYSAVEEGEDDDAPPPSIILDTGLLGNVAAGTAVEVWDPATGAVVTEWIVEVTDDLDGSPGNAYVDHALIPFLAEGLPVGVGDSVTVTVGEDGDWTVTNAHGKKPGMDPAFIKTGVLEADVSITAGDPDGKRVVMNAADTTPAFEAYNAANEQTVNIDGEQNYMQGTIATDAAGNPRVEVGQGSTFGLPADEVRVYTGHADETAPAELTVLAIPLGGGASKGTARLASPEWDSPSPTPASVELHSAASDGSLDSWAVIGSGEGAYVQTLGNEVALHGPGGVGVIAGVLNATMGAGSVGTGAHRDSVDARVTAVTRLFAGTTATAVGTAAKTATIAGYTPASGDTLALKLTNGNSVASPTLNINGGGAKAIQLGGAAVGTVGGSSAAGTIWALRYDGTIWHLAGSQSPHANTVAFAGLNLVADRLPYADGTGTLALATFTAAARALLDDASASDMLTTLGAMSDSMTSNVQTGTTYTVVAADANKVVQGNHATGITITLPTVAGGAPAVDKRFRIFARGTGPVTLDASAVTLEASHSASAITSYVLPFRRSMIELWHRATDTWVMTDLSMPAARSAMKTSATEFTTATLAADTDLSIALAVGTYDFEATVLYDGTVNNDAKFSPTFSGTATVGAAVYYVRAAAAPTAGTNVAWDNGTHSIGAMTGWGGTFSSAGAGGAGIALPFRIVGRITVTVAGNLGISVAKQNNTDTGGGANATRTLAFSHIKATPSAIA